MNSGGDRRPWLILSRREVIALCNCARGEPYDSQDFERALRQANLQLAYIEDGPDGHKPDITETLIREMRS